MRTIVVFVCESGGGVVGRSMVREGTSRTTHQLQCTLMGSLFCSEQRPRKTTCARRGTSYQEEEAPKKKQAERRTRLGFYSRL